MVHRRQVYWWQSMRTIFRIFCFELQQLVWAAGDARCDGIDGGTVTELCIKDLVKRHMLRLPSDACQHPPCCTLEVEAYGFDTLQIIDGRQ